MAALLRAPLSKKTSLELLLEPDLPPLQGDPTQLRQVVMNLITNAAQSLGESGGRIELQTGHAPPDDLRPGVEHVLLQVRDTGPGVPEAIRARIFDPFFTTRAEGSGLGLSVVQGIVRGHRGALHLESSPGAGAVFSLRFPAARAACVPSPAAPEAVSWRGDGTCLVVDDDETIRLSASAALRELGFDVLVARDGEEAVSLFRAQPTAIRVVLLDQRMPRLNGEEALSELRRIRPDVPVLLSSGHFEPGDGQRHSSTPSPSRTTWRP